jgi:HEAT repeat protein
MSNLDQLRDQLHSPNHTQRHDALAALNALNDTAAIALLCEALHFTEWTLRERAARALGRWPQAHGVLSQVLPQERNGKVRLVIAQALCGRMPCHAAPSDDHTLDQPNVFGAVCAWVLQEPDAYLRFQLVQLISQTPAPCSQAALLHLSQHDSDVSVRRAALYGLAGAPLTADSLRALVSTLRHDRNSDLRAAAAQALADLAPHAHDSAKTISAVLIEALQHDAQVTVRKMAATALSAYPSTAAVAALLDALHGDAHALVRWTAAHALGALAAHAEQEIDAAYAASQSADSTNAVNAGNPVPADNMVIAASALPLLQTLRYDPDSKVRWAAVHMLAQMGATVAQLLQRMQLGDSDLRQLAIYALMQMSVPHGAHTTANPLDEPIFLTDWLN